MLNTACDEFWNFFVLNIACAKFWNFFVLNSGFLCAEFLEFLDFFVLKFWISLC